MKLPRIIAHRGSPRAAPENTLASFRQAAREGAKWVEFDATLTRDDRPVVFHDDTLDRTTDGTGPLADTVFDALKGLDAGGWFSPKFAGEMVPTLEETLDVLMDESLAFNMEIKPTPGRDADTARITLATAAACWPSTAPTPLVSSFSPVCVAMARDRQPAWPRGMLFDRIPGDWAAIAKDLKVVSLGANQQHLTREQVMSVRGDGYRLTAYTVNERARAETLFSWGVDAIFTDLPGEMLKVFS